jgi:hypothetical protein
MTPPKKATLDFSWTASVHFRDSYPVYASHLCFNFFLSAAALWLCLPESVEDDALPWRVGLGHVDGGVGGRLHLCSGRRRALLRLGGGQVVLQLQPAAHVNQM